MSIGTTNVLSFGGGVQTTALLRMSVAGEIPIRYSAVAFGDTGDETADVYANIEASKRFAADAGIPFYVARAKRFPLRSMLRGGALMIPAYTIDVQTGKMGRMMRYCTTEFKIRPIRRVLREHGIASATMSLGFTTDEISRVRDSDDDVWPNRFPLIEANLRRGDCEAWLTRRGIPYAKSACIYCPHRGPAMWAALSDDDFEAACAYDEAIRYARPGLLTYLHNTLKPLREAIDRNQMAFLDLLEMGCDSGGCFT